MTADPNSDAFLDYDAIPETLTSRNQWVCWCYEEREKADGSTYETKVPLKPFDAANPYARAKSRGWDEDDETGETLDDPDDPAETWGPFEQAVAFHEREDTDTDGIGFMFAPDDRLVGIDLDDVHDPETGETEPGAREILDTLDTYTEDSPSATGFHAIAEGFLDSDRHKQPFDRENDALAERFDGDDPEVEAYDEGRFFTVTGKRVEEYPATVEARNNDLRQVTDEYLSKDYDTESATLDGFDQMPAETGATASTTPASADLDDETLISKAKTAENGEKFADLYEGRWESYYPSQSEADLAFCAMLAFWSQRDKSQMDRIFRDSGLMRPKWDEQRGSDTYGEQTIEEAVSGVRDVYDPAKGTGIGGAQAQDGDDAAQADVNTTTATTADVTDWESFKAYYGHISRIPSSQMDQSEKNKRIRHVLTELVTVEYNFAARRVEGPNPEATPIWVYHDPADADDDGDWTTDAVTGTYTPDGVAAIQETLREHVGREIARADRSEVVDNVRVESFVNDETFDAGRADADLLAVKNGVLDVDERELRGEHSPDYRFRSKLPVEYDPDADCPQIEWFIDDVTNGDEEKKKLLYEWAGFCLSSGYSPHRILILHGGGRNGKGVYFELLEHLLGEENTSSVGLENMTDESRFRLAQLDGALANIEGDIHSEHVNPAKTGTVKKLSGGDSIDAENKYEAPYKFHNRAKLTFGANHVPRFSDDGTSMNQRLLTAELPNEYTAEGNRDPIPRPELRDRLLTDEELSGFLNKALEGLARIREQGVFSIELGTTATERRAEYDRLADPIKTFAREGVTESVGCVVPKSAVYDAYKSHARAGGGEPTDEGAFFRQFYKKLDFEPSKHRITLRSDGDGKNRVQCLGGLWFTPAGDHHVSEKAARDTLAVMESEKPANVGRANTLLDRVLDRKRRAEADDADDDDDDDAGGSGSGPAGGVPDDAEGASAERDRLYGVIRDLDDELPAGESGVTEAAILDRANDDLGFAPDVTHELLDRLLEVGKLYEPGTDRYRPTS